MLVFPVLMDTKQAINRGMTQEQIASLANFIQAQLEEREWNIMDLSRKAGVTPPVISRLLNRIRGVDLRTLGKLARALGMTFEQIQREARMMPKIGKADSALEEIRQKYVELDSRDQEQVLAYIRMLEKIARDKDRGANAKTRGRASAVGS